jgi:hypothetical protein
MNRIVHSGVCIDAIDKPLEWAVGFFFDNTELSLELWNVIAGDSGDAGVTQAISPTEITRSPQQTISDAVKQALGESNRGVKRVQVIKVLKGEEKPEWAVWCGPGCVEVEWAINDRARFKNSAKRDLVDILKAVHQSGVPYDDIYATGTFPKIDIYGKVSEGPMIIARFKRSTVEKINWDLFQSDDVFRIMDGGKIHKELSD